MDSGERPIANGRNRRAGIVKEGKYARHWMRLSCHRFVGNQVRLALFVLAYNLGNFLRRLALPASVRHWSLRSIQVKLIEIRAKVVRHARQVIFQMAEVAVPKELFAQALQRIWALAPGDHDPERGRIGSFACAQAGLCLLSPQSCPPCSIRGRISFRTLPISGCVSQIIRSKRN